MPEHKPRPLQRDGPDQRLDLPSRRQTEEDLDSLRGNGFLQEQLETFMIDLPIKLYQIL